MFSAFYMSHIPYTGKFSVANLENHELFAKIFPPNIYRYTKNVLGYGLTVASLPNFSLPIAGSSKFSHAPKFPHVQ